MSGLPVDIPSSTTDIFLPTTVITTGCLTIVLASILAYTIVLQKQRQKSTSDAQTATTEKEAEALSDASAVAEAVAVDLDKYPCGAITIYYGTQTGTAESFSQSIEREGNQHGFLVHVVDLEDAIGRIKESENDSKTPLAARSIFITATYGEGEAPDGALPFCQWLQEVAGNVPFIEEESKASHLDATTGSTGTTNISSPNTNASNILSHVEYAVFGLGNTQYDHYNATGKFMDRALAMVGAQRIIPLGLGDDNADLEADFEIWKDQYLWPALVKRYHVPSSSNGTSTKETGGIVNATKKMGLPRCPYKVIYHDDDDNGDNNAVSTSNDTKISPLPNYNVPLEQIHSSSRHYFTAYECPVAAVRELQTMTTATADNSTTNLRDSTVHVELDIGSARSLQCTPDNTDTTLSYKTADNLGVLPENSMDVVERVANALGYNLDRVISVESAPDGGDWHGLPFPIPITIRECFLRYLDFTSAPRRSDLKRLSIYCNDNIDEKALLRMSSKEGRQEYKEKILDRYVGFVDLLQLCPSIQMPLEHLLHYCSPLQTRFFTISSSSSVHPDMVHLTVAVTKHQRSDGSMFHGVCSTHLSEEMNATTQPLPRNVRIFQRPSSFRLPSDTMKPIIMIGPGTGIAPMRALLQEREYQRDKLYQSIGSNILYFGCKHEAQDYLYRDELETFAKMPGGILTKLFVAFSRDQSPKIYVQDLLRQNGAETWNLIRDNSSMDDINNNVSDGSSEGGGAYIYVCGGVQMGHDVMEVFKEIIAKYGNMSTELAKDYMTKLSHDGRYVQELWA